MESKNPKKSQREAIKDLLVANGEVVLDSLVKNDAIKQIPGLKNLVAGYKFTMSISDQRLLKKLIKCLESGLEGLERESIRKELLEKENSKESFGVRCGRLLIDYNIKATDEVHSIILGKLLAAALYEKITFEEFRKLGFYLINMDIETIDLLDKIGEAGFSMTLQDYRYKEEEMQPLMSTGLAYINQGAMDAGLHFTGNCRDLYNLGIKEGYKKEGY